MTLLHKIPCFCFNDCKVGTNHPQVFLRIWLPVQAKEHVLARATLQSRLGKVMTVNDLYIAYRCSTSQWGETGKGVHYHIAMLREQCSRSVGNFIIRQRIPQSFLQIFPLRVVSSRSRVRYPVRTFAMAATVAVTGATGTCLGRHCTASGDAMRKVLPALHTSSFWIST